MDQRETPDPCEFVSVLAPALRASASIARALEGRVANRPKQGEQTAVKAALTVADTAAQEAILVPLHEHFPGVTLAAEEDTPGVHHFPASGPATVVVDPIDGTLRFYLEALGPYAVIIGLAVGGVYRAALVALPREELYFDAVQGAGARLARDSEPSSPVRASADGNRVLVSHDLPAAAVESLLASGFEVAPASGGAISVAPLLPGVRAGLRLAHVQGDVSIRGRVGALVAREAGAWVCDERGEPFPDDLHTNSRALLVSADREDRDALLRALAAIPSD